MRGRLALAAVAGCLALGALAARLMLRAAPAWTAPSATQPLVVVTAWHSLGTGLAGVLGASILAAAAALVLALVRLDAEPAPGGYVTILTAGAVALAACFAWPVVFSSDTYAYAAYGDLALAHLDPYRAVPPGFHDAYVDAARWQWDGAFPPCVYGPAFVGLASLGVASAGAGGLATALLGSRILAALAFLGSAAALYAALRGQAPGRRFTATCAYALNPVAVWSVAEGHNDALTLLCVLGGIALARRARPLAGGLAVGLSALLKAPGPLLGLAVALDATLAPDQRRRFSVGLAVAAGAAIGVALPFQWPALTSVGIHGHYAPLGSLQGLVGPFAALAAAGALAVTGVRRLRDGSPAGYAWLALGAWLAIPTPYPWYVVWVLPAVAGAPASRPAAALWAVTILAFLRYLPDAAGNMAYDPRILGVAALAPLIALVVPLPARLSDTKVATHL